MLKTKYLHRKSRRSHTWDVKKYCRGKNVDLFSDLPFHSGMRLGYYSYNYDITPLDKFLESKIGQNWNDIYSEILTKIKNEYRRCIDSHLCSSVYYRVGVYINPIYDDNFIPRSCTGHILKNQLFVENGFLVIKSEQEIISDAKKYQRSEKYKQIFENKDIIFEEIDEKLYEEYLIMDGKNRMKKWKK